MRIVLALSLCLPGAAHALQCKQFAEIWTPDEKIPPQAWVLANADRAQIAALTQADVHFLANGQRVDAKVEPLGGQAVIRPARALAGTVKLAGLPKAWPQDRQWPVVERKIEPFGWKASPRRVAQSKRDLGRYGPVWQQTFAVPTAASIVGVWVHTKADPPLVRFYRPVDGKLTIRSHPCGSDFAVTPGKYEMTMRPMNKDGSFGPPTSLVLVAPEPK